MRQIEVVDSGVESHWEGRCHEVLPIVTRWAWHRRLTRGRGATSSAGVTGRGNIALFLDSGIWQGLRVVRRGPLYSPHPTQKYTSSTSSMTLLLWCGEVPIELAAPPDSTGDKSKPQKHP